MRNLCFYDSDLCAKQSDHCNNVLRMESADVQFMIGQKIVLQISFRLEPMLMYLYYAFEKYPLSLPEVSLYSCLGFHFAGKKSWTSAR